MIRIGPGETKPLPIPNVAVKLIWRGASRCRVRITAPRRVGIGRNGRPRVSRYPFDDRLTAFTITQHYRIPIVLGDYVVRIVPDRRSRHIVLHTTKRRENGDTKTSGRAGKSADVVNQ